MLHAQEEEKQLVFLFDEFEYATRNKALDSNFFGGLRSLANSYEVAYVTVSRTSLLDFHYSEDLVDSPFFNIFTEVQLGSFSEEEALALVHEPLSNTLVSFGQQDTHFILDIAGRFPFFIQIALNFN